MPPASAAAPACHWDYLQGPALNGRVDRTMVFICEHPYRTIRAKGPCEECESCQETGNSSEFKVQSAEIKVQSAESKVQR